MFSTLISLLQKPKLYEKTREKFWNDPHISKGMLQTHLDPDTDAASRNPEFMDRSSKWISSLLPHGAKLLDIGCGPGLYAKRFSELGLRVTGLDFSKRSISYAKAHDSKSEYVLNDYLQMDYDNEFDMITLIWCDYGALIPNDRHQLLDRVYRALKPGGLFLLDAFTPVRNFGRKEYTSWEVRAQGGFWSPRPHICLNAEYHYGERIDLSRTVVIEDGSIRCYNIWNTCFTKESMSEEIKQHGFIYADYYSDAGGTPFDENSETLCAVIKKQDNHSGLREN